MLRKKIMTLVLSILSVGQAVADLSSENAFLQRAYDDLRNAQLSIVSAEKRQNKLARIQADYRVLQKDIEKIMAGIEEIFNRPIIQPRVFKPLEGDYMHSQNKRVINNTGEAGKLIK